MTRQRWIFVGLLGIGLVALAADRLLLGPAGAVAAVAEAVTAASGTGETAEGSAAPAGPARANLAVRLNTIKTFNWDSPPRDGFRADETWVQPPKPEAAPGSKETSGFAIAEWEAKNPLRSIFAMARQGAPGDQPGSPLDVPREYRARFGDKDIITGDYVDGCRILVIEATSVWVEHEGSCYLIDMLHPRRAEGSEGRRRNAAVTVRESQEPTASAPDDPGASKP